MYLTIDVGEANITLPGYVVDAVQSFSVHCHAYAEARALLRGPGADDAMLRAATSRAGDARLAAENALYRAIARFYLEDGPDHAPAAVAVTEAEGEAAG